MGRTQYNKIKELFERLKYEGRNELTFDELRSELIINIGSDPRSVENSLFVIKEANLAEEKDGKFRLK